MFKNLYMGWFWNTLVSTALAAHDIFPEDCSILDVQFPCCSQLVYNYYVYHFLSGQVLQLTV